VSQRPRHPLVTYAIIPFLLLSSAEKSPQVRTHVYLDGSVKREVSAEFLEERQENVLSQMDRALPEADSRVVAPFGENLRAVWSVILASASRLDGAKLQYEDVVPEPLSLFTYYTWTETLQLPSETATAVEKAEPEKATFQYVVVMPGTVIEPTIAKPAKLEKAVPKAPVAAATAAPVTTPAAPAPATPVAPAAAPAAPAASPSPAPAPTAPAAAPAGAPAAAPSSPALPAPPAPPPALETKSPGPSLRAQLDDSTATFTLSAANEAYDITVTSRRVRWGYLAVILYLLAFLAYKIAAFLVHRAKVRPRRI
jgi:hypothetical protein